MPKVNYEILEWARTTAGIEAEEASGKLGFKDNKSRTAVERLELIEKGDELPSRAVLSKMSKLYRRPLITFYMSAPPKKGDRGEDFRTLPDIDSPDEEAMVDALLRNIKARQAIVKATILAEDESVEHNFINSLTTKVNVNDAVKEVEKLLKFNLNQFRQQKTVEDAFNYLRNLAEELGIFVLLIGDLGSHHTDISVEAFRGFALADTIAPFIVVNDNDAKSAWAFTLLHELVHLLLGRSGVSGSKAERPIEVFCNDVSSNLLLSDQELEKIKINNRMDLEKMVSTIGKFSTKIKVSGSLVTYRLHRLEKINFKKWQNVRDELKRLWLESNSLKKQKSKDSESGPNYYVVRCHRLGSALTAFVGRMLDGGAISTTKAGNVLGVKPKNVHGVLDAFRRGAH